MPTEWVADSRNASLLIDLHELASSLARREANESDAEPDGASDCEMFGT
jgi:hypothetical protein